MIVITAYGDVERAVRAMREGAFDFLPKSFDAQNLGASLGRTVRFHALREEKDRYRGAWTGSAQRPGGATAPPRSSGRARPSGGSGT